MRHPLLALFAIATALSAAEQPVAVGQGSYAPAPPPGVKDIAELLALHPALAGDAAGRPLPTNDWWTALLHEPFGCRLYAMPFTVGPTPQGLRLWLPQGWNDHGTQLVEGAPFEIQAVDPAPAADADLLVDDCERPAWCWPATDAPWRSMPRRARASRSRATAWPCASPAPSASWWSRPCPTPARRPCSSATPMPCPAIRAWSGAMTRRPVRSPPPGP
jgi:hypothetical protein